MIKPGAFVVDVGLTRVDAGTGKSKIFGDVDPEVAEVAGFLTPVPGGVGPCTVACLLKNTVQAAVWATFQWATPMSLLSCANFNQVIVNMNHQLSPRIVRLWFFTKHFPHYSEKLNAQFYVLVISIVLLTSAYHLLLRAARNDHVCFAFG